VVSLRDERILVVGASAGIGRAVGIQAAAAGAHVVLAARRVDLLEEAVQSSAGASFLQCDVRRAEDCLRVVSDAVEILGGLDAVVYAAGTSPLSKFYEADAELWRTVFETNVIGAALVSQAALPHLQLSSGRLLLLGSSSVGRPYPGLVPYVASKAALHEMARGLRNEYPWLRVTLFVVGPTMTGFTDSWDQELIGEMFARWEAEGYPAGAAAMEVTEMADQIVHVLASGSRVEDVHVMPDPFNVDPATLVPLPGA